jgi:hypothetical protein
MMMTMPLCVERSWLSTQWRTSPFSWRLRSRCCCPFVASPLAFFAVSVPFRGGIFALWYGCRCLLPSFGDHSAGPALKAFFGGMIVLV